MRFTPQSRGHPHRATALSLTVVALLASGPVRAEEARVELSADGRQILVNKDVGTERWSISYNIGDDRTVTGIVYLIDGSVPKFVWCADETSDPEALELSFACSGADPCDGEWP